MIADYGGGSPTGGIAYNEDALPESYRGNLFMLEWGKGQMVRFAVERQGGSFKVKQREIVVGKVKGGGKALIALLTATSDRTKGSTK